MFVSVVIPLYNEEENIRELAGELKEHLSAYGSWEVILVDDGSTDSTFEVCKAFNSQDNRFRVIRFRKNYGQSAALAAGFDKARGEVVVTIDGDLQNNPADIPLMLKRLEQDNDVVVGWRYPRKDPLPKKFFSFTGRLLRRLILNDPIHDAGCTLKVFRKQVVEEMELRGEMHRYLAEMAVINGFKVTEMKVNHRPRKHGKTKYNMTRLPGGFLDLLIIRYRQKYTSRPVHFFGGLGLLSIFIGFVIGMYLVYIKFAYHAELARRPLLLLAVLLIIAGLQLVVMGILTDVMIRIYYKDGRNEYKIKEVLE